MRVPGCGGCASPVGRPGRTQVPHPRILPAPGKWGPGAAADNSTGMVTKRQLLQSSVGWELKAGASLSLSLPRQRLHSLTSKHTVNPTHLAPRASAARHRQHVSHPYTTAGLGRFEYSLFPTPAPCIWRNPDISLSEEEVEAQECRGIWLKLSFTAHCSPRDRVAGQNPEGDTGSRRHPPPKPPPFPPPPVLSRRHRALLGHARPPSPHPGRGILWPVGRWPGFGASAEINLPI